MKVVRLLAVAYKREWLPLTMPSKRICASSLSSPFIRNLLIKPSSCWQPMAWINPSWFLSVHLSNLIDSMHISENFFCLENYLDFGAWQENPSMVQPTDASAMAVPGWGARSASKVSPLFSSFERLSRRRRNKDEWRRSNSPATVNLSLSRDNLYSFWDGCIIIWFKL